MRTNSKVCQRLGLAQPSSINLNKVLLVTFGFIIQMFQILGFQFKKVN